MGYYTAKQMHAPQTKILEGWTKDEMRYGEKKIAQFYAPQTKILEDGTKDEIQIFDILVNGS